MSGILHPKSGHLQDNKGRRKSERCIISYQALQGWRQTIKNGGIVNAKN